MSDPMRESEAPGAAFDAEARPGWILLYDPAWDARFEDAEAPSALIAGGWPVAVDGEVGGFTVNDLHRERPGALPDPDPLDAALHLVVSGRAPVSLVQLVLRDCVLSVGVNADGHPVVLRSDDGFLCLLAATSEERRNESDPPLWDTVGLDGLLELLGDELDVLLNPRGPSPVRLGNRTVQRALVLEAFEAAEALEALALERSPQLFGQEDVRPRG